MPMINQPVSTLIIPGNIRSVKAFSCLTQPPSSCQTINLRWGNATVFYSSHPKWWEHVTSTITHRSIVHNHCHHSGNPSGQNTHSNTPVYRPSLTVSIEGFAYKPVLIAPPLYQVSKIEKNPSTAFI